MRRTTRAISILAVIASCGKSGPAEPSSRDALIAAWKQAGLQPGDFKPMQSPVGKDCQLGAVSGVDVMACSFASADEANGAQTAALQWVGDTTSTRRAGDRGGRPQESRPERQADQSDLKAH